MANQIITICLKPISMTEWHLTLFDLTNVELKSKMEHDLKTLNDYFSSNCLSLNFDKTNFIIFYLKQKSSHIFDQIKCNGFVVKRVESTRYLGLQISSNLTWNDHISIVKRKIVPIIGVLRRVGYTIPPYLRYKLYFSYIHSNLIYLIQIWGSASKELIKDLQVLQNKALKAIKCLPPLTSTKLLYDDHLLPVNCLIEYEYIMTIYKIRQELLKCNLRMQTNLTVTERITRNALNYRLPNYRFSTTQNSIFYRGFDLFNRLEDANKNIKISDFKLFLKNLLYRKFLNYYNGLRIFFVLTIFYCFLLLLLFCT